MKQKRFRAISFIIAIVLVFTCSAGMLAYADRGEGAKNGRLGGERSQNKVRTQLRDNDECERYCNCNENGDCTCDCICDGVCDGICDENGDGIPDRDRLQERDRINYLLNLAGDCDGTQDKDRIKLRINWVVPA